MRSWQEQVGFALSPAAPSAGAELCLNSVMGTCHVHVSAPPELHASPRPEAEGVHLESPLPAAQKKQLSLLHLHSAHHRPGLSPAVATSPGLALGLLPGKEFHQPEAGQGEIRNQFGTTHANSSLRTAVLGFRGKTW